MEKHTVSSKQAAIEDLKAIINIEDYPLTDRDSAAYRQVINRLRNQLAEDGCAHVANFIKKEVEAQLERESEALAPLAHFHENQVAPYANADDESLPKDHPKRFFQTFANGFVAKDQIGTDKIIRRLYTHHWQNYSNNDKL